MARPRQPAQQGGTEANARGRALPALTEAGHGCRPLSHRPPSGSRRESRARRQGGSDGGAPGSLAGRNFRPSMSTALQIAAATISRVRARYSLGGENRADRLCRRRCRGGRPSREPPDRRGADGSPIRKRSSRSARSRAHGPDRRARRCCRSTADVTRWGITGPKARRRHSAACCGHTPQCHPSAGAGGLARPNGRALRQYTLHANPTAARAARRRALTDRSGHPRPLTWVSGRAAARPRRSAAIPTPISRPPATVAPTPVKSVAPWDVADRGEGVHHEVADQPPEPQRDRPHRLELPRKPWVGESGDAGGLWPLLRAG